MFIFLGGGGEAIFRYFFYVVLIRLENMSWSAADESVLKKSRATFHTLATCYF